MNKKFTVFLLTMILLSVLMPAVTFAQSMSVGGGGGSVVVNPGGGSPSGGGSGEGGMRNSISLDFKVFDAVFGGNFIYATSTEQKKVYQINAESGEIKSLSFARRPEALYLHDNKLFVTLCVEQHSAYWWTENQTGAFGVIDTREFKLIKENVISIDPYDIVVSKSGIVYIGSGSGQWTTMKSYKQDGTAVETLTSFDYQSKLRYNAQLNRIYCIDTTSSPRSMFAFHLKDDGKFVNPYYFANKWPYHGDFGSSVDFDISSDGKYIFNALGYIMSCNTDKEYDMIKIRDMTRQFNNIAFDLTNNSFYVSMGKSPDDYWWSNVSSKKYIQKFDYDTMEPIASYPVLSGYPSFIFCGQQSLYALTQDSGKWNIETVLYNESYEPVVDEKDGIKFRSNLSGGIYSTKQDKTYLISKEAQELYVFNHETASIERKVKLNAIPSSITLSRDEDYIYISYEDKELLVTSIDIYSLSVVKEYKLSLPSSYHDYSNPVYRIVGESNDKVFVTGGEWEPMLRTFDKNSANVLPQTLNSVGGLAVDEQGKYLYYWYQYGWSAGLANSKLFKYDISVTPFKLEDKFEPKSWTEFGRDPLMSPVFLLKNSDKIILKNRIFDKNNLNDTNVLFPDNIRAINEDLNIAVGNNGMYNLDNGIRTKSFSLYNPSVLVVDKRGNVYYSKGENLEKYSIKALSTYVYSNTLKKGETYQLSVKGLYSDERSLDVTSECTYTSSNPDIISVTDGGMVCAESFGTATITIECDGVSTEVVFKVDVFLNNLAVDGYNINFYNDYLNYTVYLPSGTTEVPNVIYDADEDLDVEVINAEELPGTTVINVSDKNNTLRKTYNINFYVEAELPPPSEVMPFYVDGYYIRDNGLIKLELDICHNYWYSGPYIRDYQVVIQLFTTNGQPLLVSAIGRTGHISYVFDDKYLAFVSVVDRFGDTDYIGIPLAFPIVANAEALTYIAPDDDTTEPEIQSEARMFNSALFDNPNYRTLNPDESFFSKKSGNIPLLPLFDDYEVNSR